MTSHIHQVTYEDGIFAVLFVFHYRHKPRVVQSAAKSPFHEDEN